MTDFQLLTKISALPAELKKETEDFIDFLNTKVKATGSKKRKESWE